MRKTLIATLALCFVAGLVAFLAVPAEAIPNCISCEKVMSWGPPTVTVVTGTSTADCPWAVMDAHMKADNLCAPHGFCSRSERVLSACTDPRPPSGVWEHVIEVTYYCRVCIDTQILTDNGASEIERMLEEDRSGECLDRPGVSISEAEIQAAD